MNNGLGFGILPQLGRLWLFIGAICAGVVQTSWLISAIRHGAPAPSEWLYFALSGLGLFLAAALLLLALVGFVKPLAADPTALALSGWVAAIACVPIGWIEGYFGFWEQKLGLAGAGFLFLGFLFQLLSIVAGRRLSSGIRSHVTPPIALPGGVLGMTAGLGLAAAAVSRLVSLPETPPTVYIIFAGLGLALSLGIVSLLLAASARTAGIALLTAGGLLGWAVLLTGTSSLEIQIVNESLLSDEGYFLAGYWSSSVTPHAISVASSLLAGISTLLLVAAVSFRADYHAVTPPPGWYPDPYAHAAWRWWDGGAWTGHSSGPAPPHHAPSMG